MTRHVLLVHGMGRSAASMLLLSRRLQAEGFKTSLFNYYVSVESLDTIIGRLVEQAKRTMKPPFAAVGHSLGGVLVRAAQERLQALGLSQLVMLGSPNQPPVMAQVLKGNPVFRVLTGEAGQKIADPGFHATLPPPAFPVLVVAGNSGPKARWLPFKGAESDGVVAVEETRLVGADHKVVPRFHTFLMNDRQVTREVVAFLNRKGAEDAEDAENEV
jgi:pimeloyl-ACP methyl ester carboxylesterase